MKNAFSVTTDYKFIEEDEKTQDSKQNIDSSSDFDDVEIPEEIKSLYAEEAKEHINNIYQVLINLENDKESQKENLELIYSNYTQ